MISKRFCSYLIPRKRFLTTLVILCYFFYFLWLRKDEDEISFETLMASNECNEKNFVPVCLKCPKFYQKIQKLQKCFTINLLEPKEEGFDSDEKSLISIKALEIVSNASDYCNEAFFQHQTQMLQLVTVNGPTIGKGFGTFLFLKSYSKNLPCQTGSIGIDGDIVVETQLKLSLPKCQIMALSQKLKEDTTLIEGKPLQGKIFGAEVTERGSNQIVDHKNFASLINLSFMSQPLDALFIKYLFSMEMFVEFLEEIESFENQICQLNVRIKINDGDSLKSIQNLFKKFLKTAFYPLHVDIRGNVIDMFVINVKSLYCVRKNFLSYCLYFNKL